MRCSGYVSAFSWLCAAGGLAGCEGPIGPSGAASPPSTWTDVVAVRFEVPQQGQPTASVLAFHAGSSGIEPGRILGLVDPLAGNEAAAPAWCEKLDLAAANRALEEAGGSVELQELAGLEVELGAGGPSLRPAARLYPDLGTLVGGVVAEAGPIELAAVPDAVALAAGPAREETRIPVPEIARIVGVGGASGQPPSAIALGADLLVEVAGGSGAAVELRPFGAIGAVACPVDSSGHALIPRSLLADVAGRTSAVASLDAVRRETELVLLDGKPARVSVEVRASSLVELRR